jgi:hypothetical protein
MERLLLCHQLPDHWKRPIRVDDQGRRGRPPTISGVLVGVLESAEPRQLWQRIPQGYGGGPKNTIKGIWNALTNPIGTVAGFKAQLSHYDPAGVNTSGAGACVALGICQLMEQLVISAQTGDLEGAGEAMGDFTFGVAMGAATDGIGRALGGLGLLGKLSRWARFEPDTTPTPGRPIRPVAVGCPQLRADDRGPAWQRTSKPIADIRRRRSRPRHRPFHRRTGAQTRHCPTHQPGLGSR